MSFGYLQGGMEPGRISVHSVCLVRQIILLPTPALKEERVGRSSQHVSIKMGHKDYFKGGTPLLQGLREFGLFSMEKRRFQGNLIVEFWYLKGPVKKMGIGFIARPIVIG